MAHHLQPMSYFAPSLWMPPWLLPPKPMELQLPKPTPIYPLLDLRLEEQPLDLSLGNRQESVIQNAPEMAKGLFMPTCVAPNVKLREQSYGWLAKADKIHNSRPGSLKSGRSGRKPQFPKIEKELYVLYKQQMDKGAHKTNSTSSQKCSEQELQQGMCQFSERWLTNFKKRYGIQANGALKQGLEM
uniref:HTH CENPB-type domain-containing protein n=1 Tax=Ditylenchus dipsaci TaxID=166011 RepID=A0A915EIN4_9BILA